MKKLLESVLIGSSGKASGLISLGIIMLIVLGCNCKNLDFGKTGGDERDDRSSNTYRTSNDSDADDESDRDSSDGTLPTSSSIDSMIQETMEDFTEAIDTGDFSEIYEKSSPDFQASYTEEEMKKAFNVFTTQKNRVVPILKRTRGMKLETTSEPSVRSEKGLSILVVNGKYSTKPLPVRIENEYVFRSGEWKLLKLIVKIQ
ncbi:MAG: hypothetical protein KF685_11950 [Acidobacteria bacterium]|nr:hypothetical protein [Acidobacteriota bacterium]